MAKPITWAPREKRRSVYSAVGNNFLKTLTEPITNSDSILKKHSSAPHAAGLVHEILSLKQGDRLVTSDLKKRIKKASIRRIKVEIVTAGRKARQCRVIDAGTGMAKNELEAKFGSYAAAKAKGEQTRSLFGRGALDVLLHHEGSTIWSVRSGMLSKCRIYWDKDSGEPMCEAKLIGTSTKRLLASHDLPPEILEHGTVVQFVLKEGTSIPVEEQIISKISSFYMLRLIAADPNTEVVVERMRADGEHSDTLTYDFPIGTVLGRFEDTLELGELGKRPVSILVARSEVALGTDPAHIERRENGLLFVDDNDAVLDLTLLPDYDRNPYLKHIFGVVRISGFREVLEAKLESEDAEAVLSATRDGFDRKSDIVQKLFTLVERHVKPLYETEEKLQKKGDSKRSQNLDRRVSEALKAINRFNAEETEEEGTGEDNQYRTDALYFGVDSLRLYAGTARHVSLYVNLAKVREGEIVLFGSDRGEIKTEPDSEVVKSRGSRPHQRITLTLSCDVKGLKGNVTALSIDKQGKEIRADLKILGVDDPPVFEPPEDIAFAAHRFSGDPNRQNNNAVLWVNLAAFAGMPQVSFSLSEIEGNISLGSGQDRVIVQVAEDHLIEGRQIARLVVPFRATGWGQTAVLRARAQRTDGKMAEAKCKLRFERTEGDQKFSNFHYEDLERPVMGDVAGDKIYVNAGYALHRQIFGETEDDFNKSLEADPIAQLRAASVVVDAAVFHAATTKHQAGGKKGLHIDPDDPIGSLRPYLDQSRIKLEPKVYKALVVNDTAR